MLELKVLQAVRLKGRVAPADLAATIDEDTSDISEAVASLRDSGLLIADKTIRLSPQGRERLAELLSQERSSADAAAILAEYGFPRRQCGIQGTGDGLADQRR